MKVLQVSTMDFGGAANSCYRLHKGLLSCGVGSEVLLRDKTKQWPEAYAYKEVKINPSTNRKFLRRLLRRLKKTKTKTSSMLSAEQQQAYLESRADGLELFSFPTAQKDITSTSCYRDADLINFHWVAGFLDYSSFFNKNEKPLVWTMHDMNPFSGGEHYSENYCGFDDVGDPLRRELSSADKKAFDWVRSIKKDAFSKSAPLHVVCPSKWLKEEALKSGFFDPELVHCIPYGVEEEIYKPMGQAHCRSILEIPANKKVFLFVAESLDSHRKGLKMLLKAFYNFTDPDIILVAVGNLSEEVPNEGRYMELGYITDQERMAMAYAAADFFVIPSLMDNLPNTVLESLLCGTPVVGFPVGGIIDMVEHQKNGFISDSVSVEGLTRAMEACLVDNGLIKRELISQNARSKYALHIQARRYKDLYERILCGQ
jgi:glycosyltransferase involved in cell wall biosynthesis